MHSFVTSRIDYCISLLAGSTNTTTNRLQRVMNAAARILTNTNKFHHGLSDLIHSKLHLLDITERIQFRLGVTVYKSLHGMAPAYLSDLCIPVSSLSNYHRLRRGQTNQLLVPKSRLSTIGPRSFAVAGPALWNSLPSYLTHPSVTYDTFRRHLKTFLFARY